MAGTFVGTFGGVDLGEVGTFVHLNINFGISSLLHFIKERGQLMVTLMNLVISMRNSPEMNM